MGSVGLALGEYFAANTAFTERFVCRGAVHDTWLEKVPISLVLDPHIAVAGALALASDM
jgi:glucokinase